jgi:hypothetical protein
MHAIRAFFRLHRHLALGLVLLALAMKALTPVGFMPNASGKTLSVMICDGTGMVQDAKIAIPGDAQPGKTNSAKADGTCPYAGLSLATLGGTDALLSATPILFILALGFAPATIPPLRRRTHVQPPQCGPPAFA